MFRSTRSSFLEHERAKVELKGLMPEDAKEAIGHGGQKGNGDGGRTATGTKLLNLELIAATEALAELRDRSSPNLRSCRRR